MTSSDESRVILAITETAPIDTLWQVVSRWLSSPATKVVALFVADDRWIRAASLPFTREIPRAGGAATVFTPQRAEHVHRAAIARAQSIVEQLASKANRHVDFRVLAEGETQRVCEFIDEPTDRGCVVANHPRGCGRRNVLLMSKETRDELLIQPESEKNGGFARLL